MSQLRAILELLDRPTTKMRARSNTSDTTRPAAGVQMFLRTPRGPAPAAAAAAARELKSSAPMQAGDSTPPPRLLGPPTAPDDPCPRASIHPGGEGGGPGGGGPGGGG